MKSFLVDLDLGSDDFKALDRAYARYQRYLRRNQGAFPRSAYGFAIAPWHYDIRDHRCPHDSWVESLTLVERGRMMKYRRPVHIELTLLGAYHDGRLRIDYKNVESYGFTGAALRGGLGDWLIDEVRLTTKGRVIHEVVFEFSRWRIECKDLSAKWAKGRPAERTVPPDSARRSALTSRR